MRANLKEKHMVDPIRLGLMVPQTKLASMYGTEIALAAEIARDEINARGGILGRPLELVIEDDGSMPDTAVPAARRLVEEARCNAIVGTVLSSSRLAVASRVTEERRIPYLNFTSYEGSISGRYFFHFAALPNQLISKMLPYMVDKYGPRFYFAGSNDEWSRGLIDAAKAVLRERDAECAGEEYLPTGAHAADINRLLERVARSGANVFMPCFPGSDQADVLERFSDRGLKKRMAVAAGHFDEVIASRMSGRARSGIYACSTYFMTIDNARNRAFLDRLSHMPGFWPNGYGILTAFGTGAYVCVHAFASAVELAGSPDSESVVDALEQVSVCGPQGKVVMDPASHHASASTWLGRCDASGAFEIVESFGHNPPLIPDRYRSAGGLRDNGRHVPAPVPTEKDPFALSRPHAAQKILSLADMAIIAATADGTITEANPSACLAFGYAEDELVGMSMHLLLPPHARQRHAQLVQAFIDSGDFERRMSTRNEVMGYRKDGSQFPLEVSIAKFRNGRSWLLVATMRDVTESRKVEAELLRRTTHDPVTGLANRHLFRERLMRALHRSRRDGKAVALLFLDLDGFKLINETHGHEVGDGLLRAITSRLIGQLRGGDSVGRLESDEFVILCEHVEQPENVAVLAERLIDVLRAPFEFDGRPLFVTASIGIAVGTGSTHSADDMLRFAGTATHAVKERGRDGWEFFSQSLHEQARQRLFIANGLRLAINRDELSTRFQPIVAADSGRIVGAELLLRWRPPEGEVSPALFIPIAEMTGSIVPIGAWVFREACRAEAAWRMRWGDQAPYVSLNLSTRQLSDGSLADLFAEILRDTGADPSRITLEITETSLMADVESNLQVLSRLAGFGLRVAVDDFGTGYSSLAQLTRMPVEVMKIDRMFVECMETDGESRLITRAIINLGKSLGLKLVAEGVDSQAQWRELCSMGCDFIQGYLFHRPMPEKDFIALLDEDLSSREGVENACMRCQV
ncbi:EAL domain-containing protein [Noviherbaspirillum denitrificans]|uniref:Diguanylate cyclase n=1 Tax=Noviherbaspirillum denitrificans TaxID=1968433 RepID=A0A254TMN5_9BURK|nr:EAL domain-containing protein [Noviherbaspirillum denitrificans]OWW21883.1 hypothetical protein AYR66_22695 [Noviherbaspirillum denitrificans]